MSKHSLDLAQVQKLITQAQAAETSLSVAQAALSRTQQEHSQLQSEIEAETAKFLNERKKELKNKLEPLEAKIEEKTELLESLEEAIKVRSSTKEVLESEIKQAQEKLKQAQDDKRTVVAESHAFDKEIDDKKDKIDRLAQRENSLSTSVGALEDKKHYLEGEIEQLIDMKAAAEKEAEDAKSLAEPIREKARRELDVIRAQTANSKAEYNEFAGKAEAERAALAQRAIDLNDREKVIRAREIKVSQGEDAIKQNASLLEL